MKTVKEGDACTVLSVRKNRDLNVARFVVGGYICVKHNFLAYTHCVFVHVDTCNTDIDSQWKQKTFKFNYHPLSLKI